VEKLLRDTRDQIAGRGLTVTNQVGELQFMLNRIRVVTTLLTVLASLEKQLIKIVTSEALGESKQKTVILTEPRGEIGELANLLPEPALPEHFCGTEPKQVFLVQVFQEILAFKRF
jgi:hypothetical protein